jgi:phosphatidylcholine synthase
MVLYFYLIGTDPLTNFITVVVLAILTFIPVKFVHPLRVTHWRNITVPMTVLWAAMALSLIIADKFPEKLGVVEAMEKWAFALSTLYFAVISLWRTFILGDEGDDDEAATQAPQPEAGKGEAA